MLQSLLPREELTNIVRSELPNDENLVKEVVDVIELNPDDIGNFSADDILGRISVPASNKTLKQRLSSSISRIGEKLKKTFKRKPKQQKKLPATYSATFNNPVFETEPAEQKPVDQKPVEQKPQESYEIGEDIGTQAQEGLIQETSFPTLAEPEPIHRTLS